MVTTSKRKRIPASVEARRRKRGQCVVTKKALVGKGKGADSTKGKQHGTEQIVDSFVGTPSTALSKYLESMPLGDDDDDDTSEDEPIDKCTGPRRPPNTDLKKLDRHEDAEWIEMQQGSETAIALIGKSTWDPNNFDILRDWKTDAQSVDEWLQQQQQQPQQHQQHLQQQQQQQPQHQQQQQQSHQQQQHQQHHQLHPPQHQQQAPQAQQQQMYQAPGGQQFAMPPHAVAGMPLAGPPDGQCAQQAMQMPGTPDGSCGQQMQPYAVQQYTASGMQVYGMQDPQAASQAAYSTPYPAAAAMQQPAPHLQQYPNFVPQPYQSSYHPDPSAGYPPQFLAQQQQHDMYQQQYQQPHPMHPMQQPLQGPPTSSFAQPSSPVPTGYSHGQPAMQMSSALDASGQQVMIHQGLLGKHPQELQLNYSMSGMDQSGAASPIPDAATPRSGSDDDDGRMGFRVPPADMSMLRGACPGGVVPMPAVNRSQWPVDVDGAMGAHNLQGLGGCLADCGPAGPANGITWRN